MKQEPTENEKRAGFQVRRDYYSADEYTRKQMAENYNIDYNKCWWGREKNYLNYPDKLFKEC